MAKKSPKTIELYKIGEVSRLTGGQPFVLRFWEKEFGLKLPKASSGHRFYRQENVQEILTIKRLLYSEGFTIKGAIQKMALDSAIGADSAESAVEPLKVKSSPKEASYARTLQNVRSSVVQLLKTFS